MTYWPGGMLVLIDSPSPVTVTGPRTVNEACARLLVTVREPSGRVVISTAMSSRSQPRRGEELKANSW